jgi:GT2 family glycosyltransferase
VTVAVLNYNGEKNLSRFFPSVLNIAYPNYEIMVVDGGSSDGSMEFLSQFQGVRVIDQGNILGTGRAVNAAVENAKGKLILFLGNDMLPNPDILSFLVPAMGSSERIGVCCPKILSILQGETPSDVIDHVGLQIDRYGFPKPIGFGEHDHGQYDDLRDSWWVGGCEALIRKAVFEVAGPLDETYFTMADDIDFCWRLHLQGYKILLEPRAVTYHDRPLEHETTTKRLGRARIRYYSERNTQRTIIKNYSTATLFSIVPAYLGLFIGEVSLFALIGRIDLSLANVKALVQNIKDFKNIWKQHLAVQSKRLVSDSLIVPTMNSVSYKLEILREIMKSLGTSSIQ